MAKTVPDSGFTPSDAAKSLGKVGDNMLASWARTANDVYWSCMADDGEDSACKALAIKAADERCKPAYRDYAAADVPEDAEVRTFAGGWLERRDHGQTLANVEVFRVGTWNGEKYAAKDLDDMVAAFGEVGFRPPVKLGHTDEPDAPAYGWVANLRRDGDVLKADFEDLPDDTYEAIKEGRYDAVSSEIFFDCKRDKKSYRRVLAAVALLGAQVPGVSHLKPLRASMAGLADATPAKRLHHTMTKESPTMTGTAATSDPKNAPGTGGDDVETLRRKLAAAEGQVQQLTAQAEGRNADAVELKRLSEQVEDLQRQTADAKEQRRLTEVQAKAGRCPIPSLRSHFTALYDLASRALEAGSVKVVKFSVDGKAENLKDTDPMAVVDDLMERVQKLSTGLLREHARGADLGDREAGGADEDPGQEVDRLAKKLQADKGIKSYGDALSAVLAEPANADLARRYATHRH